MSVPHKVDRLPSNFVPDVNLACLRCGPVQGQLHIDWELDHSVCRTCAQERPISEITGSPLPKVSEMDLLRPPDGCQFQRSASGFTLSAQARPDWVALLCSPIVIPTVVLIAATATDWRTVAFALVLLLTFWQVYPAAAMHLLGHHEVTCSGERFVVHTRLGRWVVRERILEGLSAAGIRQLPWSPRGQPGLVVELHNAQGSAVRFGVYLTHAGRAFIVRALRDGLTVPPPPPYRTNELNNNFSA
jgi:hypothetical protein